MNKSPAVQFYWADFVMDTQAWTCAQLGAYIRLLAYEWVNGSLPVEISGLARIAGVDPRNMQKMWSTVIAKKFTTDDAGMYVNRRMEEERQKQTKYIELQKEKGIKGADKRWHKDMTGAMPVPQPNDSSSSSSSSSDKKNIYTHLFEDFWKAYPKRNGTKVGKQKTLKLFTSLLNGDRELIIKAAENYSRSKLAKEGFAKDPERFLKDDYWRDWIEAPAIEGESRIL